MRVMELHSPVTVIKRSSGRTATAAAAYRSASRIECERTGQAHDYTRKQGVEATALLLPDDAPDWAHDRGALWNAAELREKRKDAQTAREITIAFPAEFNAEQRREAGLRIGQLISDRYGAAVDLAWHQPSQRGDERNDHVHMLFTTRRFVAGEWAEKKDRLLDDRRTGPEEIKALRAAVAGKLNDIAARDELDVYVEHLSFERRGLDIEATQHMGPDATNLERRGVKTAIGDKNRDVRARNEERRRLREERKVLDFAIEGERIRQRGDVPSPAPDRPAKDERTVAYEGFYASTQQRRRALLEEMDTRFSGREKELTQELVDQYAITSATGIVRLWRSVTGQTKKAEVAAAQARDELADIHRQRAAAAEHFEQERQEQLDTLKVSFPDALSLDPHQQQLREQQAAQARQLTGQPEPAGTAAQFTAAASDWKHDEAAGLSDDERRYPLHEAPEDDPVAEQIRERLRAKSARRGRGR